MEHFGCPGQKIHDFSDRETVQQQEPGKRASQLKRWHQFSICK
ncbi:MAG: hypothetical protein SCK70_11560 [bacterium]|nr:hypothetical protein [bacterium]